MSTYEADTSTLLPGELRPSPHLCFIDGEHTDECVVRDFAFCRAAMPAGGLVLCHDTPIVYRGLSAIIDGLDSAGAPYAAALLPDTILAIDLGNSGVLDGPELTAVRAHAFRGALASLGANHHYRARAARWPWGPLRQWRSRWGW